MPRRPTPPHPPRRAPRLRRVLLSLLAACALVPAAVPQVLAAPERGVPTTGTVSAAPTAVTTPAATTPAAPSTSPGVSRPSVLGTPADADDSGLDVEIEDLSPRVLTTQDRVVVQGTITNTSGAALEGPLHIEVHLQSVTPLSQDQLTAFLSGTQLAGALVATTTLDRAPSPSSSLPFSLTLDTAGLPLGDSFEWGPRGLSVDASAGTASGGDRTFLLWDSGYEVARTRVGTLVPWTSASAADSLGETDTALALAGTKGVTLAVDPEVLAAVDRPESEDSQQSGILPPAPSPGAGSPTPTASPSSSATSAPPATPSSTSDPGTTPATPPAPPRKRPQTPGTTPTPGGDLLPTSGGEAPTSGGDPGTPTTTFTRTLLERAPEVVALPSWDADLAALAMSDSKDLLALASDSRSSNLHGGTATVVRDVVWPTAETFGRQALRAFPGETFVAPPGALSPTGDVAFTSVTRVEVDPRTGQNSQQGATSSTVTLLSSQASLADLLSWDPESASDRLDTDQVLTALSAVITRELPNQSRTLFVPVSRGTTLDDTLADRLHALLGHRWVEPQTFSQVASSEPTDLERQTVPDAPALDEVTTQAFTEISDALTSTSAVAEAIPRPRELLDRLEDAALETLSATGTTQERTQRLADFRHLVHTLLTAVRAEPSATVNLINKSANFPVRVTNGLPWDAEVVVTLEPSDPRLRATATPATKIPAHSTISVDVPVTAIGSGDITVAYRVSTTSGTVLDDTQSVTVRMRAGWEDTATAVVAGILVVMLVAGVARTVRRRLRDRSATEED